MKGAGYQMLNQIVKDDGDHDAGVGGKHKRGQDQPGPVVIHPQSIHERDPFSLIEPEQAAQSIAGGKGHDAQTRRQSYGNSQKIPVTIGHRLGERNGGIRVIQQQ